MSSGVASFVGVAVRFDISVSAICMHNNDNNNSIHVSNRNEKLSSSPLQCALVVPVSSGD